MTDSDGSQVACPLCKSVQDLPQGGPEWAHCLSCQGLVFKSVDGPRILIAHKSEDICRQMGEVLLEAGFSPLRASDGVQAIQIMESVRPPVAVLDVALEGTLAFQVIQHLRKQPELKGTKVVLLASVYNKTAYKRSPRTLYGADDYVEQHHVSDKLPVKLAKLLNLGEADEIMDQTGRQRISRIQAAEKRKDLEGRTRIQTLAHNIVADIALYHQADIEHVVQTGDLSDLAPMLEEGRRLLSEMVDQEMPDHSDPIMEAFQTLIDRMQQAT